MYRKYIKTFFIILPVMLLAAIGFSNCAPNGGFDSTSSSSTIPDHANDPLTPDTVSLPYALLSAEQVKHSMLQVTGVNNCANLETEYKRRYSTLAAGNNITLANGPLLLGSMSLAGKICGCLYEQEKALADGTRLFYNGVNFNSGIDAISETAYQNILRGLTRSFWARYVTDEEQEAFNLFRSEFTQSLAGATTTPNSAKIFLNATCAAALASFDSMTY